MKMPKFFKLPKAPKLPPWLVWVGLFLVIFTITSFVLSPAEIKYAPIQFEDNRDSVRSFDMVLKYLKDKDDVIGVVYDHDTWGNDIVLVQRKDSTPLRAGIPYGEWHTVQEAAEARHLTVDGTYKPPLRLAKAKASVGTELLTAFGPTLLLIAVWYWAMKKFNPMSRKNIQPKHIIVKASDIKDTLEHFAGNHETKELVEDAVEYLRDPTALLEAGGKVPKGILMVGPPGNGKTLLARCIAGEAKVTFITISAADFVETFVGVGAGRVRLLFEDAKKHAPCIIFIDELDAVGRQRGGGVGGGNDEREQTLNQLLTQMDGFEQTKGILVLAATNRDDVLDKALLRPGRFDQQVTVELPDLEARVQILTRHMKGKTLAPNVTIAHIADSTWGFSGADLEALLNRAVFLMYARMQEAKKASLPAVAAVMTSDDIEQAIMEGAMKSNLARAASERQQPEVKLMLAYHEACHGAVTEVGYLRWCSSDMAWGQQWGKALRHVTIIGAANTGGHMQATPDMDTMVQTRESLVGDIACALGATIGERYFLHTATTGNSGDLQSAYSNAKYMVTKFGMNSIGPISVGEEQGNPNLGAVMGRGGSYGLSEYSSQQIDHDIAVCLAEGAVIAIRALLEREQFVHAAVQELVKKGTLTRTDWVEIWSRFDNAVVTDTQVVEWLKKLWPELARLTSKAITVS